MQMEFPMCLRLSQFHRYMGNCIWLVQEFFLPQICWKDILRGIKVPVETLNGKIYNAWLYFNDTKTDNLIAAGDYADKE